MKRHRLVVEVIEDPLRLVPEVLAKEGWKPVRLNYVDQVTQVVRVSGMVIFLPSALDPMVLETVINDALDPDIGPQTHVTGFGAPEEQTEVEDLNWEGAERL